MEFYCGRTILFQWSGIYHRKTNDLQAILLDGTRRHDSTAPQGRSYLIAGGCMCTPKFKKSVIAIKILPYKHHSYIIYMHPQEMCTPFLFTLASPLRLQRSSSPTSPLPSHGSVPAHVASDWSGSRSLSPPARLSDGEDDVVEPHHRPLGQNNCPRRHRVIQPPHHPR
jgi:hypothetical protein